MAIDVPYTSKLRQTYHKFKGTSLGTPSFWVSNSFFSLLPTVMAMATTYNWLFLEGIMHSINGVTC